MKCKLGNDLRSFGPTEGILRRKFRENRAPEEGARLRQEHREDALNRRKRIQGRSEGVIVLFRRVNYTSTYSSGTCRKGEPGGTTTSG